MSMFYLLTSNGTLQKACAQSEWNNIFLFLHILPIFSISWIEPISLFTIMIEAMIVFLVILDSNSSKSILPC